MRSQTCLQPQQEQYPGRRGQDGHNRTHAGETEMEDMRQTCDDEPDSQ